jgi:hypothetical protein
MKSQKVSCKKLRDAFAKRSSFELQAKAGMRCRHAKSFTQHEETQFPN